MHSRDDQELAFVLLVELLANQFASPVRWAESQDVLLAEKNVQRYIEIGPSDTLVSMAKKTLAAKHASRDAARSLDRKLLYYKKDEQEIRYEIDGASSSAESAALSRTAIPSRTKKPTAKKTSSTKVQPPLSVKTEPKDVAPIVPVPLAGAHQTVERAVVVSRIPDAEVTAGDVVTTVVAQKMKKPFGEVPREKTVKQIVGGRSTLENEIVGDLVASFGTVPDKSEEIEIDELGKQLQKSFSSDQLQKALSALTSRFLSQKMPGGFNAAKARQYIGDRWGFASGRQDAILLHASTVQPPSRLASTGDAEAFFDDIIGKYTSENGLSSSPVSVTVLPPINNAQATPVNTVLSPASKKRKQTQQRAKLELLAKNCQVDLRAGDRAAVVATRDAETLRKELDQINAEIGDVFANGVQPLWASAKIRRFDSFWNWVVQDTISLISEVLKGRITPSDSEYRQRLLLIANRATPRLITTLRQMTQRQGSQQSVHQSVANAIIAELLEGCEENLSLRSPLPHVALSESANGAPKTTVSSQGLITYDEVPRPSANATTVFQIQTKSGGGDWVTDVPLTKTYNRAAEPGHKQDLSFKHKTVLLTGASAGSIGSEVLRGLLTGGARVIITARKTTPDTMQYFQKMYMHYGSEGSELIVVPFNQGSQQDIESLVSYVYDSEKGLGWDLNHIIPFAALPEAGREVDGIDSQSELAHRVMLTNVIRLLGAVKKHKQSRGLDTSSTQIILPLSPNHGDFGNDGLYAESKLALETLYQRWHSESWSDYLAICGARIGWTRGTGLMAANNVVADGIEELGVRTFSQGEMAMCILALMIAPVVYRNEVEPISADLTGGLSTITNLKQALEAVRTGVRNTSDLRKALATEEKLDRENSKKKAAISTTKRQFKPQADMQVPFPKLPSYDTEISPLATQLKGMVDLDRVVVVTGFAEVGPYGNSRTRWEMEAQGTFSLEGCVEMAWLMGLIKHYSGDIKDEPYSGWVDTKTNEPVNDANVKARYESQILEHAGIRLIDSESSTKTILQEIILETDLPSFTAPKELAEQYENEHGDFVDVFPIPGEDEMSVQFKAGATLLLPKALRADRRVAGHVPEGWDARTYGVTEDIVTQVDRVTLYALVSTVEALLAAGITDPYEIYQYIHVSEIGNCIGSGLGGIESLEKLFKGRHLDKSVQNDVLAESFINTTPAWINMLILSSVGPIRTAVGACATSIESLETGYETIVSGRAKMCLVGGFDDFGDAVAAEFANMKATVNVEKEFEKGRTPREMSRPTASSRNGFVESHGSGVEVITSAQLAIDMGLPIHGIVAWAGTSSDKISRSVPAPGKGILTNARESRSTSPHPLMDIDYRRRRLEMRQRQIKENLEMELETLQEQLASCLETPNSASQSSEVLSRIDYARKSACKEHKDAAHALGSNFYASHPSIAPIRGALAVWNLTIDDLSFASFHGTSTVKNDLNESRVIQSQLSHLGRTPGNLMPAICQKYLTGHPKGAAGAWMFNGALQVLDSGIIPGNRNADNIDAELQECDLLMFPHENLHMPDELKAFSLTSFGFGQKGAQAIGVHPRYLFATLEKETYEAYREKVGKRQRAATQFFQRGMAENSLFRAKDKAPYLEGNEKAVLLDPTLRVGMEGF